MKKINGYKVLYGIRGYDTVRCSSCGYEWTYNLFEEYCPRCGARF